MKLLLWIIIIAVVLLAPVIPSEREVQRGTTVIEEKCIAVYLYDRYQQVQEGKYADQTRESTTSE